MADYILRRCVTSLLTLLFAALVVFVVLEVLPGNAALVLLGPDATPAAVAALTHKLGLDEPAPLRFAGWIAGLLRGDFGVSAAYGVNVATLIGERLAVSLPLALIAMLLTTGASLTLGLFAASRQGRMADTLIMGLSQIGLAVPNFWIAILLVLLFAVEWRLVSAGGFPGWGAGFGPALAALALPALSLALVQTAILTRVTRAAVLDIWREDFVRTARAKGLSRSAVLWRHVLRNAMAPILTIMGLQFSNLIAGTVVIENVFTLPGLGRLIFQSISNRDTVVVRDCVLLLAVLVVLVNLAIDLLYAVIDPRLRIAGA